MEKKRLLVSIVNYRTSELICNMLPELMMELNDEIDDVVIVDNASNDGSVRKLNEFIDRELHNHNLLVLPSLKNGGFAYGNNYAINYALQSNKVSYEYILLLNPDTLVSPGSISQLFQFMEKRPKAGIAGSRLVGINGKTQISAFNFPSIASEFLSGMKLGLLDRLFEKYLVAPKKEILKEAKVDWVAGASMLIRYRVLEDAGMMDENYFLYYEETDFCYAATRQGWEVWYVPSSLVTHMEGQSTGVSSNDTSGRRLPRYWFQSRQYYFKKNYGVMRALVADIAWMLAYSIFRIRCFFQRKKHNDPKYLFIDFLNNSILMNLFRKKI